MNEMIKIWLENLYQKEIAEIEANIRNHTLWRLGAKNKEEEQMETGIIINLYEYIDVLKELIENLEK